MSPLCIAITVILYSVIPSKVIADFCTGSNYIEFNGSFKPDSHGTYEGTTTSEEIEFHFYSTPGLTPYLGVVIYFRKDSTFYRMHDARLCCFMSPKELGNVVQRLSRETLVYKLIDSCYQVTYGYKDMSGPYVKEAGYISCSNVDICRSSMTVPVTPLVPQLTPPRASVDTPGYGSISARFGGRTSTGSLADSTAIAIDRFPLGASTSSNHLFTAPTSTSSRTDRFIHISSPPPSTVGYPLPARNPLIEYGGEDFCKGTKNYITLDPLADFGKYKDSVMWGKFKLTLYSMPEYQTSVSGLELKYLPTDLRNPREMSLGKYRVCCGVSLSTMNKVLRQPGSSTLVFKLQEYDSRGTSCRMITYTYVSTSEVRDINLVESTIPCLELSFCKSK